ncbi:MAG: spore protease YyaC [Bacillota bacterium]
MANLTTTHCQVCSRKILDLNSTSDRTICNQCAQQEKETSFCTTDPLPQNRIHVDDRLAASKLKKILTKYLDQYYTAKFSQIIVLCIGTDRSTGDALGPLIGSRLNQFNPNSIPVLGTLKEPIHATNLQEKIDMIKQKFISPFIVAIDAGLGKNKSVGQISVNQGPLKPGSGVDKELPPIGNLHITGLVNIGGYMEYLVLQSTRLNLVMKMSKIIARSIKWSLKSFDYNYKAGLQ